MFESLMFKNLAIEKLFKNYKIKNFMHASFMSRPSDIARPA
jgi:hypothetical protein